MADALPAGWADSTIGDVCEPVAKRGPNGGNPTFRYIDLSSINNKTKTVIKANELDVDHAPSRAKQVVQAGDVLFSNVRVYLENIASVPADLDGEIASTAFCVLRPASGIEARYLHYFATSRAFIQHVDSLQRGNSPPSVQDGDVKSQAFPAAPHAEQRRIVSKIDELFSRIDEGEQALKRVEKLIERYRQSVLKAAVTGELTRDWREARKRAGEPVESGAALLARILKARRAAWEAAELKKLKAKGKIPTDDRWKQKYKEPAPPNTTDLSELPEGWVWASLDTVADITGGITVDAKRSAEGCELVPYLRVANVQRGYLDLTEMKSLLAPTERVKALVLRVGDILFNEGGDLDKLGRGWIWDGQIPVCIHQNHVFRARLFAGTSRSRLVSWYANEMGRSFFLDKGKQTTNLASISLTKLKALPVPVMGEHEAMEIENRASAALAILEHQLSELKRSRGNATALRQSILKAAFSGRLVPQDPSDEPASKLLERIAAERASTTDRSRRKTKRSNVNHG